MDIFQDAKNDILEMFQFTDEQVDETLELLEYAKTLYSHQPNENIPQCIVLQAKNTNAHFRIRNHDGIPTTVFVTLPFWTKNKLARMPLLLLGSLLCLYKITNPL